MLCAHSYIWLYSDLPLSTHTHTHTHTHTRFRMKAVSALASSTEGLNSPVVPSHTLTQ